jgi:hypothetical protein
LKVKQCVDEGMSEIYRGIMRTISRDFRIPFSVGMLITVMGSFWDAWRHLNGLATSESLLNPFINPAHGTIYGGATIMAISILLLVTGRLTLPISLGYRTKSVLLLGIAILLAGGLYDFWWHTTYGFADSTPWTPSHMTATAGFVILLVTGVVSLSKNSSRLVKGAFTLSLLLFIALWGTVILLTSV